jgi:hypothetical protein
MHASASPLSSPSPSPSSPSSPRWASWLFWLAAVALTFPIYGHFLLGNLPVGADNTLFYAPFFAMHWQGGPPRWNPYSLSGTALYDNLQSALLYPPRWPFYFVADWRDFFA